VDLTFIEEIEELFRHRWVPYILLCLADGPQRYSAIAHVINQQATDRLSDSVLSRSLDHLEAAGLAQAVDGGRRGRQGRRRGPWMLTPAARPIVAKLQRLQMALADDVDHPPEHDIKDDPDPSTEDGPDDGSVDRAGGDGVG